MHREARRGAEELVVARSHVDAADRIGALLRRTLQFFRTWKKLRRDRVVRIGRIDQRRDVLGQRDSEALAFDAVLLRRRQRHTDRGGTRPGDGELDVSLDTQHHDGDVERRAGDLLRHRDLRGLDGPKWHDGAHGYDVLLPVRGLERRHVGG